MLRHDSPVPDPKFQFYVPRIHEHWFWQCLLQDNTRLILTATKKLQSFFCSRKSTYWHIHHTINTFTDAASAIILFLQDKPKQTNDRMIENKLWESLFLAVMCLMKKKSTWSATEKDTLECKLPQVKVPCWSNNAWPNFPINGKDPWHMIQSSLHQLHSMFIRNCHSWAGTELKRCSKRIK